MIVAFNYKFAKSNLPPNSSKLNFNHANVFCSLFALNHRLLCNHVHCILRAAGERHARTVIDSIFSQLTLLTPDFLPQFHAPSLITNWLILGVVFTLYELLEQKDLKIILLKITHSKIYFGHAY